MVDSVVAQHSVAKVTGSVDGFMLVTGMDMLEPHNNPTYALAMCAIHLLSVARRVSA